MSTVIKCDYCGAEIKGDRAFAQIITLDKYGVSRRDDGHKYDLCKQCKQELIKHIEGKANR